MLFAALAPDTAVDFGAACLMRAALCCFTVVEECDPPEAVTPSEEVVAELEA